MPTTSEFPLIWDLDSILPHPSTDAFRETLETFRQNLQALAERSDSLPAVNGDANNVAGWTDFLHELESVSGRASELNSFVGCQAAADANDKLFQQLEGRLSALDPLRERIATNVEFALKSASESDVSAFIAADEWLREIAFYIGDRRRNAELRLPKEQEMLAADLAVDGIHAWGRLYDRISGSLRITVMEKGELVEKSVGQVQFDSPQRDVRENNFFAADTAWSGIADTCADAVNHIAGTRLTLYRHLGLADHLEAPCRDNRMRRETLDAMWSAVSNRKGVLLKYLQRKAQAFGLEKPTWYDVTAPYPIAGGAVGDSELPWNDACNLIIETFNNFSPEFGDFARLALKNGWVEAENRSGKRQGGFCTGFPVKQESRIFMTYTDSADSMSTLAHELGHAYHSWVLRERPLFLRRYPMNLAETASTFAEAVLGEQRLQDSTSAAEQLKILDLMLSDSVAFLMNIHARFLFEDSFHQERADGELTADRLSELMESAQQTAYVNGLADDGWNRNFWISKLHFYISGLPFYNFPYTFGYLLSLGVYAVGKESGGDFPAQYRELLIATGCQETEAAVQSTLGYDLTKPDFWNKSLDIVDQRVERFLELANAE
jgi:pepF/M3 family oligoendopeptidase